LVLESKVKHKLLLKRTGLLLQSMLAFFYCRLAAQPLVYPLPIYSAPKAVAMVTVGNFDPMHPGEEIACLLADGSIVELALQQSGWMTKTIFEYEGSAPIPWNPAMRVTLNVGDVLSEAPGPELVLSFQQQLVVVYYWPSFGWTNQVIRDFSGFVATTWGAESGDCDPTHPGEEILSIVEGVLDFSVGTLYAATNGNWQSNDVYAAEVGMDAAIGDSNPDVAGNEIVVVTEMGPAYEIMPPAAGEPGPWPKRMIWDDFENAGWVAKIGDVDPESPGKEIVYGTRYSDGILMSRYNGTNLHKLDILLTGVSTNPQNSMLDVAIGQIVPGSRSKEVLGVDLSGSVYVAQRLTNDWNGSILWHSTNALYTVAAADFIPGFPGDEIVVAGVAGTVTLLCNPAPSLSISLAAEKSAVLSWTAVKGVSYSVESTTNRNSSWSQVTNLLYEGAFSGTLWHTNTGSLSHERYFRVKTSW